MKGQGLGSAGEGLAFAVQGLERVFYTCTSAHTSSRGI